MREHTRILGVGGYRPARVVTERGDLQARSTPPTSGSASAPASSPATRPTQARPSSTWPRRRPREAHRGRRLEAPSNRRGDRRHRHALPRRPRGRGRPSPAARRDPGRRVRHLRRLRRLLLRPGPGRRTGPRRAAPTTCWSSAPRSSPTSSTRRTARSPSCSATAPAPWSSAPPTPGIGPTVWGSDGAKSDTISQTLRWT